MKSVPTVLVSEAVSFSGFESKVSEPTVTVLVIAPLAPASTVYVTVSATD
jgi:hypothetical protein